jgi:hypothetical protein
MIILKHSIGFLSENELCSIEYISKYQVYLYAKIYELVKDNFDTHNNIITPTLFLFAEFRYKFTTVQAFLILMKQNNF